MSCKTISTVIYIYISHHVCVYINNIYINHCDRSVIIQHVCTSLLTGMGRINLTVKVSETSTGSRENIVSDPPLPVHLATVLPWDSVIQSP